MTREEAVKLLRETVSGLRVDLKAAASNQERLWVEYEGRGHRDDEDTFETWRKARLRHASIERALGAAQVLLNHMGGEP